MRLPLSYLLVFTSEHCLSFSTRHGRSNAIAVPDLDYVETGDYDDEAHVVRSVSNSNKFAQKRDQ